MILPVAVNGSCPLSVTQMNFGTLYAEICSRNCASQRLAVEHRSTSWHDRRGDHCAMIAVLVADDVRLEYAVAFRQGEFDFARV